MNSFEELIDYVRNNLKTVLAIAMIILVILGDGFFAVTSLLPEWRAQGELVNAQESAEESINQALGAQLAIPDRLQAEIDGMQMSLEEKAASFVTISQANDILRRLFLCASESGAEIVEIQAVVPPRQAKEDAAQGYEVNAFSVQAVGSSLQLMMFTSRIKETRVPGVVISNLMLEENDDHPVLSMNILLYTSVYAKESTLTEDDSSSLTPLPGSSLISPPLTASTLGAVSTPISLPVCDCYANLYNCRDFPDKGSAQACYDFCGGATNDIHRLDIDLNGIACETVFP